MSTQFSSIWPIDRTLSSATTPGQNGPGSDGNERVFHIPQSSSITGTSPSDCLVSYLGHSLGAGLPLCRDAVCVFYSPSRLGKEYSWFKFRVLFLTGCHIKAKEHSLPYFIPHCWRRRDQFMTLGQYLSNEYKVHWPSG